MCQFPAFVHPQMILKTDTQANSQADRDRQPEEQAVRQEGRLKGLKERSGSEVKTLPVVSLVQSTGGVFMLNSNIQSSIFPLILNLQVWSDLTPPTVKHPAVTPKQSCETDTKLKCLATFQSAVIFCIC